MSGREDGFAAPAAQRAFNHGLKGLGRQVITEHLDTDKNIRWALHVYYKAIGLEIKNWVNYEIRFKDTHEKVRFLLRLEKLLKSWKDAKMIDSFHVKHHHNPRVLRI